MEDTNAKTLAPLLYICRSWRSVGLSEMFVACEATIGKQVEFAYNSSKGPDQCITNTLQPEYNKYVRFMTINLNLTDAINHSVIKCIDSSEYLFLCLPNVHTLNIRLLASDNAWAQNNNDNNDMNTIVTLTEYLARLLPSLQSVYLELTSELTQELSQKFVEFCSSKHCSLDIQHASNIPLTNALAAISNLSKLSCAWNDNYPSLVQILHCNATMLQELVINYVDVLGFENLVMDRCGECISYPYLNKLVLTKQCSKEIPPLPPLSNAAPFPRLKTLHIAFVFPFSNELPFRGNSGTLVDIDLCLDSRALKQLHACGAFTGTRMRALDSLVLDKKYETTADTAGDVTKESSALLKHILGKITRFCALDQKFADQFLARLDLQPLDFDNLQVLSVHHQDMSLLRAAGIIDKLPQLLKLQCTVTQLGEGIQDTDLSQAASMLSARFRNTKASQLQIWQLHNHKTLSVRTAVSCILLLSFVCPQLNRIAFSMVPDDMVENIYSKLAYSSFYAKVRRAIVPDIELKLDQIDKKYYVKLTHHPSSFK
ncbi:hypothetical protein IWW36_001808 [Coemansia brasiliensis]|uniref:Uncharacterized protein n=1 Tax=Coemansia brasiliensis TaxID=2650707 RepID=A0A9W8I936_9FUNG|nr:hypothetical protein IWW36_001808 [Coemansia brasiliensis]